MKKIYLLAATVCLCSTLYAQDSLKMVRLDDVVITGNKAETTIEKSGKTIYKLEREQIEANRGKDITDLLNEIPGVQIDGNFATPGTDIGYRVRGAESEQTLIIIDGIPYNDPSGLQQTFDLRMLDFDQVESIEVLKGGLSTLYGTGAAAGVINITLKEATKEKVKTTLNVEYGSFNTFSSNANISGRADKFNYTMSGSYKSSSGFSAAVDTLGTEDFDNDGIESFNFLGKFGYEFTDQFSIGLMTAYDKVQSDFDGGFFEDDDSELDLELIKIAFSSSYGWTSGSLKGNFSYHENERMFNTPARDPESRDISLFSGNTFQADILLDQNLSVDIKLIGGVNLQRPVWEPEGTESESFTMVDPYASLIYDLKSFNLQVGGRLNYHSLYGSNLVWNVNPSYNIDVGANSNIKILGSYATAFLAPSLNQLYAGDFGFLLSDAGNPDLNPQESASTEAGFELISNGKLQLGAVYFYRTDNDFIDFISTGSFAEGNLDGKYENIEGEIEVNGLELSASYAFLPQLTLSGHYTYTQSLTDEFLLTRVPENKLGFTLTVSPIPKMLVKLSHIHVGEVIENEEITLAAYDLFDGFVSYSFNQLTISGSINNIFNVDYFDRFGWLAAERNFNIGLRYSF